ncbi:casein kinase II subunit beta-like [Saccostrea echinata]|uniref:casein kinase II subunit beta-like n=1 Tax=Saccostrea echinata TaxID=191078 RepID=UPI002A8165A7|nr:casein kinase II subunit beta-like [Saccostrea echinata]XP_061165503.1 casein kinase II subunit beta-like [Saccostrea echinata]
MVSLGGPPKKRKLRPGEEYWIPQFCKQKGNEFFCEVDDDFISDEFNLQGLRQRVRHFQRALDIILDLDVIRLPMTDDSELSDNSEEEEILEEAAERLYGLIHARYILTRNGIDKMIDKWQDGVFGSCPRVYCKKQFVLPIGITESTEKEIVRIYCPKCEDVYRIRSSRHRFTDGAFFGTSFPQMLLMFYPEYRPKRPFNRLVPRSNGLKIHPSAHNGQDEEAADLEKKKRNSHGSEKRRRDSYAELSSIEKKVLKKFRMERAKEEVP